MNGAEEKVHVLDHKTGETLSTFGRPGHLAGNFIHGHTIATDSDGNSTSLKPTTAVACRNSIW